MMSFSKLQLIWSGLGAAALVAALSALGAGSAAAAPQALALVATSGDVVLKCDGEVCRAEMSAFCLQPGRTTPTKGTKYSLVEGAKISLHGRTREGAEVSLDSSRYLKFESARTYVAVSASVSRQTMTELALSEVWVKVGDNVSLLPVPTPGDDNPQDALSVDLLANSLRRLGARIIDQNRRHMVAARLTSRMINATPERGWVAPTRGEALWQETMRAVAADDLPAAGVGMARRAVNFCSFALGRGSISSLRRCLQKEHDNFLVILNSDYWSRVRTGS